MADTTTSSIEFDIIRLYKKDIVEAESQFRIYLEVSKTNRISENNELLQAT